MPGSQRLKAQWNRIAFLILASAVLTFGVFYVCRFLFDAQEGTALLNLLFTVVFPALSGGISMLFTVLGTPFFISWLPYPVFFMLMVLATRTTDGMKYLCPNPFEGQWNGWVLPAAIVGALLGLLVYKLLKLDVTDRETAQQPYGGQQQAYPNSAGASMQAMGAQMTQPIPIANMADMRQRQDVPAFVAPPDAGPQSFQYASMGNGQTAPIPVVDMQGNQRQQLYGQAQQPTQPYGQNQMPPRQAGDTGYIIPQNPQSQGFSPYGQANAGQPMQQVGQPVQQGGQPVQQAGRPVQQAGQPVQQAGQPAQPSGQPYMGAPGGNASFAPNGQQPVGFGQPRFVQPGNMDTGSVQMPYGSQMGTGAQQPSAPAGAMQSGYTSFGRTGAQQPAGQPMPGQNPGMPQQQSPAGYGAGAVPPQGGQPGQPMPHPQPMQQQGYWPPQNQ